MTVCVILSIIIYAGLKLKILINRKDDKIKTGSIYNEESDEKSIINLKRNELQFQVGIIYSEFENSNSPYVQFKLFMISNVDDNDLKKWLIKGLLKLKSR